MTARLKTELREIHETIESWFFEAVKGGDAQTTLAMAEAHFQKVELKLTGALRAIQALDGSLQKEFITEVRELKSLVEAKHKLAELELKEIKARMDSGRAHAKAIRAYAGI